MGLDILIVDDSKIIRAIVKKTLIMAEIPTKRVYEAENGKEALEVMSNNNIDLVFADINMPVMTGIEMIDIMAEKGLINTIKVIVISSEGSLTRIEQLMNKGVTNFLRKPCHPEIIRDIVISLFGDNYETKCA